MQPRLPVSGSAPPASRALAAPPQLRALAPGSPPGSPPAPPPPRPPPPPAHSAPVRYLRPAAAAASPRPARPPPRTATMETTFIMIKPDGVQRGLVGEIIKRFEQKGYMLKALKFQNVSRAHAEKHYEDLNKKPFFAGLVEYIIRRAFCRLLLGRARI